MPDVVLVLAGEDVAVAERVAALPLLEAVLPFADEPERQGAKSFLIIPNCACEACFAPCCTIGHYCFQ